MHRSITALLAIFFLGLFTVPALAQAETGPAVEWLQAQMGQDGGFSDGMSDESAVGPTAEAVFAALAAGEDPSTWGDTSPLDFLAANAAATTESGSLAKLILAAKGTGQDPTSFAGVDLVEQLEGNYDQESGLFEGLLTDHAYAILALHNTGNTVPEGAAAGLETYQDENGGWSFDGKSQADTNTTALAIQALIAAGEEADSETVAAALDFLRSQQNDDGGFPYQTPSDYGTDSDANSTAWVIQALLASGQDLEEWNDPQAFLQTLQTDDGAFEWQEGKGANFLATAQAVPAVAEVTLLDLPVVEASQAPAEVEAQESQDGQESEATEEAPESLPETGGSTPWGWLVAAGALLLLATRALRPVATRN